MYSKAYKLIQLAKQKGITIGSVESLTAGLLSSTLAEVSGASAVLKGGLVTYASELKIQLANVPTSIVLEKGVVSPECALAMAQGGQQVLKVDLCVSLTGNAGPEAMENKPVGLVYVGLAYGQQTRVLEYHLTGDRAQIRQQIVEQALQACFTIVEGEPNGNKNTERNESR